MNRFALKDYDELLKVGDLGVDLSKEELKKLIEVFTYLRDRLDHALKKHQVDIMKDQEKSWATYGAFKFVSNCLRVLKEDK